MATKNSKGKTVKQLHSATVRFAGDSGDGMQLAGTQFSNASAVFGNDISTFPDYPSEIRAPAGSLPGVSGFQINFSAHHIHTPGDRADTLVAMNPAALKTNIADVAAGGIVIANTDAFDDQGDLQKAGYDANPLEDGSLDNYRLYKFPIARLTRDALADTSLSTRATDRCKNFFALGLACWLYSRPLDPTIDWINRKFGKSPIIAEANTKALKAGYNLGETTELIAENYTVRKAKLAPGRYRQITGNEAAALGLVTAAKLANKTLFYGSYPITPASELLHALSRYKNYNVKTFQAEDEIAAMCSIIGASFGGALSVTGTSGPGIDLKNEAIGMAVMMELPCVIVNVQRGGPSTGMPTKPEQSDLLQALYGRHGECPLPVLAASTPGDCFDTAMEAMYLAVRYMTPVIMLSDSYLANSAAPWRLPDPASFKKFDIRHPIDPDRFQPYKRNERLARPWAIPGTKGLEHRIGSLEKADVTGEVCYDPENHDHMTRIRARKIANIAKELPLLEVDGNPSGRLLVVGWGGTCGAITGAVEAAREHGLEVSRVHLRHLFPFPSNLGEVLATFEQVNGRRATQKETAALKDGIQIVHNELDAEGVLSK